MRLQRLVVGLLGAALLGAVPVALTSHLGRGRRGLATRIKLDKDRQGLQRTGRSRHTPGTVEAYEPDGICPPETWCSALRHERRSDHAAEPQGGLLDVEDPRHPGRRRRRSAFSPTSKGSVVYRVLYSGRLPTAPDTFAVLRQATAPPRARATRTARASSPAVVSTTAATWTRAGATSRSPSRRRAASPAAGTATRPCAPAARVATAPASTRRPAAAGTSARSCRPPSRSFVQATGGVIYTYRARTARGAGAGIGG